MHSVRGEPDLAQGFVGCTPELQSQVAAMQAVSARLLAFSRLTFSLRREGLQTGSTPQRLLSEIAITNP